MPPHPLGSRCFVNVPFNRLQSEFLNLVLENRLQPEIGLEGDFFYTTSRAEYKEIADLLRDRGLACTLHAPFYDLAPGGMDREVRRVSREKLRRTFELIPLFDPVSIVCHLHYEENKHGNKQEEWLRQTLTAWRELLPLAAGHQTRIMLENTYETGPEQHRRVFTGLTDPRLGFCLDTGHTLAFAGNSWRDWLPDLEPWLGQLHLHDNHGDSDNHLPIGQGVFDFAGLFGYLKQRGLNPLVTLEPRDEQGLWESLAALERLQF